MKTKKPITIIYPKNKNIYVGPVSDLCYNNSNKRKGQKLTQQEQLETMKKCVAKFKSIYNTNIPPIRWNKRLQTVAGKVRFKNFRCHVIELNPRLLITPERLESTLMHELAHVAAINLYQSRGHGKVWKQCMIRLGRDPRRCHNYEEAKKIRRKQERFTVACDCREYNFTKTRINKIKRGVTYTCRSCFEPVRIVA